MPKVTPSKLSKSEVNKMLDRLYEKLSRLKTKKEIAGFMDDLLTESELVMILRRLQVAKMLLDGKTYFEIRNNLNVGADNIKSVRKKIDSGRGGYINFIKRL